MKIVKKILLWILNIFIAIFLVIGITNFLPSAPMSYKGTNPFRKQGSDLFNIPHGGAKLLAPENTVYSYKFLTKDESYDFDIIEGELEFDVEVLEIDLALTKDKRLITHHDLTLDKSVFGDDKKIKDYDYDEIILMYEDSNYQVARNFYDPNNSMWSSSDDVPVAPPEEYFVDMVPADLENDLFKVFEEQEKDILYILEIKDTPEEGVSEQWSNLASETLVDLIRKYKLEENVVLSSFSDKVIAKFRELMPEAITNFGVGETSNFSIFSAFFIDFFWKTKGQVLIVPNVDSYGSPLPEDLTNLLNKLPKFIRNAIVVEVDGQYKPNFKSSEFINDAHRKNIAVFFWTINDEQEMEELIKLGVDGIITDKPDLLDQVMKRLASENSK